MKSVSVIIAHPDDETAASGTIAQLAKTRDVYIICATSGDAGANNSNKDELLLLLREDELRDSARTLGVKHVSFLGFRDGSLCNNLYHETVQKIKNRLKEYDSDTLITFEPRGISGHLDHIALSFIVRYLYDHLSDAQTLMYACMSAAQRKIVEKMPEYFVYFPAGYTESEVNQINDISDVWETKLAALRCHRSQKKDVEEFMLPMLLGAPKEEYFQVFRKG